MHISVHCLARICAGGVAGAACLAASAALAPSGAATARYTDPATTQSFTAATSGMTQISTITFGTTAGNTVQNLTQLASLFDPYGIAGTIVINSEWERYQTFNPSNFVLTPNALDITATIPAKGGLFAGGIDSGQIWTKQTFQPGVTGYTVYGFDVHMKIPGSQGMWPAAWFYSKGWGARDSSEIDNPEFMVMQTQSSRDWTGYDHGPAVGKDIFSRKNNIWVWTPGIDFAQAYHDYQLIWTPDAVFKYVDGLLVYAQAFKWTSAEQAQFGINLAVGSSTPGATGLQPTSLKQFPAVLAVDRISIWAK